ncbi:hypothetical protein ACFLU4_02730 [Chloroflexota bacterium]
MPKGPLINNKIIKIIGDVYSIHPNWQAKEVQHEVCKIVRTMPEYRSAPPDWPGLSSVQKELTKIRKRAAEVDKEDNPLGQPWSIGSLVNYDLPAAVIPLLLEINEYLKARKMRPLDIHLAQWIARLFSIVNTTKVIPITEVLFSWAFGYGVLEASSRITDTPLDTSRYDHIFHYCAEGRLVYCGLFGIIDREKGDDAAIALTGNLIKIRSKSSNELTKKEEELIQWAQQLESDVKILIGKQIHLDISSIGSDVEALLLGGFSTPLLLEKTPEFDSLLNRIESLANELTALGNMDETKGGI